MEIDCWDGPWNAPSVTHGHTFCTTETFLNVAKAVADCAWLTSTLPIVLSLEMHCSPKQQQRLANMLVEHISDNLMGYDELAATGRALLLSPTDLVCRVLVKGKIKVSKKQKDPAARGSTSGTALPASDSKRNTLRPSVSKITTGKVVAEAPAEEVAVEDNRRSEDRRSFDDGSEAVEVTALARRTMNKKRRKSSKGPQDEFYKSVLSLRSLPIAQFLEGNTNKYAMTITSINEDRLLQELRLPKSERILIEGVHIPASSSSEKRGSWTAHSMDASSGVISSAKHRLAANPPSVVGTWQRRTTQWHIRAFPHGFRFSGKNMSPLTGWLVGAQHVALNMSNCDLGVHLHFALFNSSLGYVLKPSEMRAPPASTSARSSISQGDGIACLGGLHLMGDKSPRRVSVHSSESERSPRRGSVRSQEGTTPSRATRRLGTRGAVETNPDELSQELSYWPPARDQLHCATIRLLSIHQLPKRREKRPRYDGSRGACHKYHLAELSGVVGPPDESESSSLAVSVSLHPTGGFSAVSTTLPLPQNVEHEFVTSAIYGNGMNAPLGETVHCIAAEPHATFLRIGVIDEDYRTDIAYTSAVLGRLRRGYRVLQLRNALGTRIELAYLLVHIGFSSETNFWPSPRHLRDLGQIMNHLAEDNEDLKQKLRNQPSSGSTCP